MAVILLLAGMLIVAVLRVHAPFGTRAEGRPLGSITLSFRERMLLQRTNLYLIGGVILITVAGGLLRGPLELIAFAAVFGVLLIPARYTLTSDGIALNQVVFRRWSDFTGFREARGAIVLEAVEGQRDFRLHVTGAHREAARRALARIVSTARVARGRAGSSSTHAKPAVKA